MTLHGWHVGIVMREDKRGPNDEVLISSQGKLNAYSVQINIAYFLCSLLAILHFGALKLHLIFFFST